MTMQGAHAHDISTILDKRGIAVGAERIAPAADGFYGVTASAPRQLRHVQHHGRGGRADRLVWSFAMSFSPDSHCSPARLGLISTGRGHPASPGLAGPIAQQLDERYPPKADVKSGNVNSE